MSDVPCLHTVVRNMTGKAAFFGFLPPHGKRLESGAEYSYFGSVDTLYSSITKKRHRTALQNAVNDGNLVIVSTPTQHYYDYTKDETKVLSVANGVVTVVDPCWGDYSSSQTAP